MKISDNKIKLAIVDDDNLFREMMSYVIRHHRDWKNTSLVIEAENGKKLIEELKSHKPDIVLLDLNMPEMDGFKTTSYLRKHYAEIKVIVITRYKEKKFIIEAVKNGARAYLFKTTSLIEVKNAIINVMETTYHYNECVTEALIKGWENKREVKPSLKTHCDLTRRQLEVLELICQQYTTTEIAEKLNLAPRTVEGHRARLMDRIDVENTAGIVAYAYKYDLLDETLRFNFH